MNMLQPAAPAPAPASASPKTQVRRCASCGENAVVLVFEWVNPHAPGDSRYSTLDYRCQGCGSKFSLHPKVGSWTFIVVGLVMGFAIFPLGFTLFGWLRLRRDGQNPVVPGAARSIMKYRDGPPQRKCGSCGAAVQLTNVTRRTSRGVPTGTEYEYACGPCKKAFVVESTWGHVFSLMSSALIAAIGCAFLFGATSPGWRFGGGGVTLLLVLFVLVQTGVRISNRYRYPVVD